MLVSYIEEGDDDDDDDFVFLEPTRDYDMEKYLNESETLMHKLSETQVPIETSSFMMPIEAGLIQEITIFLSQGTEFVTKLTQAINEMHTKQL